MRTIAVILGDNDFGRTFFPLMETLRRSLADRNGKADHWDGEDLTEQMVSRIILEGALFHYIAFQYSFNPKHYGGANVTEAEHLQHMKQYLVPLRILFDDAADADILNGDHDGGAWYLEIQSGQIGSY